MIVRGLECTTTNPAAILHEGRVSLVSSVRCVLHHAGVVEELQQPVIVAGQHQAAGKVHVACVDVCAVHTWLPNAHEVVTENQSIRFPLHVGGDAFILPSFAHVPEPVVYSKTFNGWGSCT